MKPKPMVSKDGKNVTVRIPLTFRQKGGRKLIVVPGGAEEPMTAVPNAYVRDAMVKALARAFRWRRLLESGDYASIGDLAKAEKGELLVPVPGGQAHATVSEDRGNCPRWAERL